MNVKHVKNGKGVGVMRFKAVKHILEVILFSAIPALFSYLASSDLVFNKLIEMNVIGSAINIPVVQDCCLWISIVSSALLLSLRFIITKIKYDLALEERNLLIRMNKNVLAGALRKICFEDQPNFDVRIFIPKHPIKYKLAEMLRWQECRRKFIIKNIDLIAEQGTTKDLEFEVYPRQEGLVGECYQRKCMVYDDNLEENNNTLYNLRENQISRTANLKWSICCPVLDANNQVIAIMALDGKTKIEIKNENKKALNEHVIAFSRLLYDSVPQLFKR